LNPSILPVFELEKNKSSRKNWPERSALFESPRDTFAILWDGRGKGLVAQLFRADTGTTDWTSGWGELGCTWPDSFCSKKIV